MFCVLCSVRVPHVIYFVGIDANSPGMYGIMNIENEGDREGGVLF